VTDHKPLKARARTLAGREGISYTAALNRLRASAVQADDVQAAPVLVGWLETSPSQLGNIAGDYVIGAQNRSGYETRPLWLSRWTRACVDHPDSYRILQEPKGWYGYVRGPEPGHWLISFFVHCWAHSAPPLEEGNEYRLRIGPADGHRYGQVWQLWAQPPVSCAAEGCGWPALHSVNRLEDGLVAPVCDAHREHFGEYPAVHAGPLAVDTGGRTTWPPER